MCYEYHGRGCNALRAEPSEVFPKGIPHEGYYIAVATDWPALGLTAYNLCYKSRGFEPHLVLQVAAETLCMMGA